MRKLHKMESKDQLVYLAEDHILVAQGIASLLAQIGYVHISIFGSGKELYKACLHKKPDLVLLDIYMSEWDGIHTLQELRKNNFTMPIVMVSMIAEKKIIDSCIESGANAYLHKSCDVHEMSVAINTISKNKIYIAEKLLHSKEVKNIQQAQSSFQFVEPLTEREKEVLMLLCEGMSVAEVATALFISPNTAETHKKKLLHKFDVKSVSKMIALSFKHKLV
jgi:two-component system, NarL family, response regulator DegU